MRSIRNIPQLQRSSLFILLLVCAPVWSQAQLVIGDDTLKGNIRKMTVYAHHWEYNVKTVYTWDTAKGLISGQIVGSERNPGGRELFKYDEHNRILETGLYCEDNTLCMGTSYQYDAKGRKTVERRVNAVRNCCQQLRDGVSATLSNWVGGARWQSVSVSTYAYDNAGRVLTERGESFNIIEEPADETEKMVAAYVGKDTTISQRTYAYDPMGRVAETRYERFKTGMDAEKLDTIEINEMERQVTGHVEKDTVVEITSYQYDGKGNKTVVTLKEMRLAAENGDTSIKITHYKYDSEGNEVEETVYTGMGYRLHQWYGDDKPYYTRTTHLYDARNNLVEKNEYYDASTQLAGAKVGGGSSYTYDSLGNMTSYTAYDIHRENNGSETKHVKRTVPGSSTEEMRNEYDKQGNVIKTTVNGRLIFSRDIEYF